MPIPKDGGWSPDITEVGKIGCGGGAWQRKKLKLRCVEPPVD